MTTPVHPPAGKPPAPQPAAAPTPRLEWARAIATPLATVLTTVFGGYYVSGVLKDRETQQANERLYTQLLIQREASDATIRKDMFGVVINQFLNDMPKADWNKNILQLELLGSNFNQSLDLSPLFKDLARRLHAERQLQAAAKQALQQRLDRTALALNLKQLNALKRRGFEMVRIVGIGRDWRSMPIEDRKVLTAAVSAATLQPGRRDDLLAAADLLDVQVEILGADLALGEIEVRVLARLNGRIDSETDRHFRVGRYDFPMLDNLQLPGGLRAAVVVSRFQVPDDARQHQRDALAALHLVVFPATSASFKERQDYDDLLMELHRNRAPAAGAAGAKGTGG